MKHLADYLTLIGTIAWYMYLLHVEPNIVSKCTVHPGIE